MAFNYAQVRVCFNRKLQVPIRRWSHLSHYTAPAISVDVHGVFQANIWPRDILHFKFLEYSFW